jgi:hypothetical protein
MAALTVAAKKERNARILSFLLLGGLVASSTSYLIAPRFQEPVVIADQANSSLGSKILVNERLSLLSAQEASADIAKATLLELQTRFPSNTETASLEQAINEAVISVGLAPSSFVDITIQQEFISIADPLRASDPNILSVPEGQEAKMYNKSINMIFEGDTTRLVSLLDALINLERVLVVDKFVLETDSQTRRTRLVIDARTFLMPNAFGSEADAVDLEEVDSLTGGEEASGNTAPTEGATVPEPEVAP